MIRHSQSALDAVSKAFTNKLTEAETYQHKQGYLKGYQHGRAKRDKVDTTNATAIFSNGYAKGYKHGRGHRAKEFK